MRPSEKMATIHASVPQIRGINFLKRRKTQSVLLLVRAGNPNPQPPMKLNFESLVVPLYQDVPTKDDGVCLKLLPFPHLCTSPSPPPPFPFPFILLAPSGKALASLITTNAKHISKTFKGETGKNFEKTRFPPPLVGFYTPPPLSPPPQP